MTSLSLATTDPTTAKTDVLVIAASKGDAGPVLTTGAAPVDAALAGGLARALADVGFTGAAGETARFSTFGKTKAPSVLAVGLGETAKIDAEAVRRAVGAGLRAAAGSGRATLSVGSVHGLADADVLRAICEGALLGSYEFTRFHSSSHNGHKPAVKSAVVITGAKGKDATAAVRRAEILAAAVGLARDLANTPPGDLHPADLAAAAKREAADSGLAIEILDEKALKRGKFGGILGVGQGSDNPPRLVRLTHTHPKAKRTVAFIGKGITFDSGGLSLKPAASMEWMKADMSGAAAVIGVLGAVARLKLPINVTGWIPTAENMPSGAAIRPGDVLTMYSGTRVEVLNTDAEGRLILADALARAAEEQPDLMIDIATLTGAQIVALGNRVAGLMANDDDLRERVWAASKTCGEPFWPMPLPQELRKSIDSDVGDITNVGDKFGGMLVAGIFLKEFVPEGLPWAHLDIAGPSWNGDDPWGYTPKGGTGAGVRTVLQFIEDESARA